MNRCAVCSIERRSVRPDALRRASAKTAAAMRLGDQRSASPARQHERRTVRAGQAVLAQPTPQHAKYPHEQRNLELFRMDNDQIDHRNPAAEIVQRKKITRKSITAEKPCCLCLHVREPKVEAVCVGNVTVVELKTSKASAVCRHLGHPFVDKLPSARMSLLVGSTQSAPLRLVWYIRQPPWSLSPTCLPVST